MARFPQAGYIVSKGRQQGEKRLIRLGMHTGASRAKGAKHRLDTCRAGGAEPGKSPATARSPSNHNSGPASRGSTPRVG